MARIDSNEIRVRIHERIRKKVSGTESRPRLCVFRSNKHIYAQIVDDAKGSTVASACSRDEPEDPVQRPVAALVHLEAEGLTRCRGHRSRSRIPTTLFPAVFVEANSCRLVRGRAGIGSRPPRYTKLTGRKPRRARGRGRISA